MKIFSNLWANFKFFFTKNYSRTHRLGELYEKELYTSLIKDKKSQGNPILMKDLAIKPKLDPKKQNWQRAFKVPELIINATTLNTGHNWQFSTEKMGEPPTNILSEINAKYRLRRMEYKEAGVHENIRLGHVVAASSGVPGIFDPLAIKGLYKDVEVQLVDGGVHDNQGATSLLQQECSILLVSDASGQLQAQAIGNANPLTVLGRTNSILMERVRERSFQDLNHRNYSGMIKALFFVHLTKALNAEPKNWIGIKKSRKITKPSIPQLADLDYGINPEIQQLVSEIRTDLDAFNEQEAYALMYSGYKMAEAAHKDSTKQIFNNSNNIAQHKWQFLDIEEYMTTNGKPALLKPVLKAGSSTFLKVFKLVKPLKVISMVLLVLSALAALWWGYEHRAESIDLPALSIGNMTLSFFLLIISISLGKSFAQKMGWIDWQGKIRTKVMQLGAGIGLFLVASLYLFIFNGWYYNLGKIEKLKKAKQNRDN